MAAGQGFKEFVTGEVLTAGDVNGYLMQGVLVFASAAARNAAITSPQEGQFAFTKDTNGLWYYDGAAWVASGATGDIEGVTAGVGISGGGTSGTVTVTNSMATAIDAKGDLVAGTGADTFSRIGVGANGTVLTADSTAATGLAWAAPSGSITAGSTGVSLTGLSAYDTLDLLVYNLNPVANTQDIRFYTNNTTATSTWSYTTLEMFQPSTYNVNAFATNFQTSNNYLPCNLNAPLQSVTPGFPNVNSWRLRLTNCKATGATQFTYNANWVTNTSPTSKTFSTGNGMWTTAANISSLQFQVAFTTFYANGGYQLYGG
jgi:hypothetical protein